MSTNPQANARFDLEAEGKREAIRRTLAATDEPQPVIEIAAAVDVNGKLAYRLCEDLEAAYPARRSVIEITTDVSTSQPTTRAICKRMVEDDELTGRKEHGQWQFRAHKPDRPTRQLSDDEIRACPDCDSSNVRRRRPSMHSGETDGKRFACKSPDCGITFDEPVVREKRSNGGESAEKILERVRADIEARRETATDGGQR